MLSLLTVHIAALVAWCGLLLYLTALVSSAGDAGDGAALAHPPIVLARPLFNLAATPAALVAIMSGTALFLIGEIAGVWLILKLTAVAGMVVCHALCGALIMRRERVPTSRVALPGLALGATAALLMAVVLWLVLAKPFSG